MVASAPTLPPLPKVLTAMFTALANRLTIARLARANRRAFKAMRANPTLATCCAYARANNALYNARHLNARVRYGMA